MKFTARLVSREVPRPPDHCGWCGDVIRGRAERSEVLCYWCAETLSGDRKRPNSDKKGVGFHCDACGVMAWSIRKPDGEWLTLGPNGAKWRKYPSVGWRSWDVARGFLSVLRSQKKSENARLYPVVLAPYGEWGKGAIPADPLCLLPDGYPSTYGQRLVDMLLNDLQSEKVERKAIGDGSKTDKR